MIKTFCKILSKSQESTESCSFQDQSKPRANPTPTLLLDVGFILIYKSVFIKLLISVIRYVSAINNVYISKVSLMLIIALIYLYATSKLFIPPAKELPLQYKNVLAMPKLSDSLNLRIFSLLKPGVFLVAFQLS